MNEATGIDAAWQFPSREGLRAWKHGGGMVVSGYHSYTPSKNWTPQRIELVHGLGLGSLHNWESTADRALSGYGAGQIDGRTTAQQIHALYRAVGYEPKSKLLIPFSVDFDSNPGQYRVIDSYLRGAQDALGSEFGAGDYGEFDLVVHTAKAGTSHVEWQTYAWSGGKFAAGVTDFYQWRNSQRLGGADVDFDQVINAAKLGAWWPKGSMYDTAGPRPIPQPKTIVEELMALPGAPKTWGEALDQIAKATWDEEMLSRLSGKPFAARQFLVRTHEWVGNGRGIKSLSEKALAAAWRKFTGRR